MNIAYVYADHPSKTDENKLKYQALVQAIHDNSRHSACLMGISEATSDHPGARTLCAAADVIVIQGDFDLDLLRVMQRWRAGDKILIANMDDAYHLLPEAVLPEHPDKPGNTGEDTPPGILRLRWGLQLVHAAVACSLRLADDCSPFTRAYYLPDFIDLSNFETHFPSPHDGIVLGWRGSRAQAQGFLDSGLSQALSNICHSFPHMRIALGEPQPYLFTRLAVPDHQKQFYPLNHPAQAAAFWSQVDIGLSPAWGVYGQQCGRLALLEYMVMRIPWVASETQATFEVQSYGRLVKNRAQDWQRAILQIAATIEEQRSFAAGSPYIYALSQGLESNIEKLLAVYEEIYCKASEMV